MQMVPTPEEPTDIEDSPAAQEAAQLEIASWLPKPVRRRLPPALGRWINLYDQLGGSGRGPRRIIRVARTVADPTGSERITVANLAEELQYRRALPGA
jgi:hypothetical protein